MLLPAALRTSERLVRACAWVCQQTLFLATHLTRGLMRGGSGQGKAHSTVPNAPLNQLHTLWFHPNTA
jgi:hypothetical protein